MTSRSSRPRCSTASTSSPWSSTTTPSGNVKRIQRELYGNLVNASDLTNPDFVRLAESFGLFSQRATSPAQLQDAVEQALSRNEPALIEVPLGELSGPWPYIILPRVRG